MVKRHWRIAVVVWWAVSLVVGFTGCKSRFDELIKPMPISERNIPWTFHVVGFKHDKPVLLVHEVGLQDSRRLYKSDKEFRQAHKDALWKEDCRPGGPFTFYIDPKRRRSIERVLTEPIKNDFGNVAIKILSNNPKTREQRIFIDYKNDDYSFYSIYTVSGKGLTPLEYGDMMKRDGAQAAAVGIRNWFFTFIPGRVVIAVVFGLMGRRRTSLT